MGELGYSKITKILAALGLELKLQQASANRSQISGVLDGKMALCGIAAPPLIHVAIESAFR
jgi:hypothetical protein